MSVLTCDTKLSLKMKAVVRIIAEDEALASVAWPLLDLAANTVDWEKVFQLPLTREQRIMCQWAFSLWEDEAIPGANPFADILGLDANVRKAILKAASIRWRL